MKMKTTNKLIMAVLLIIIGLNVVAKDPNVIIIMTDDIGYGDIKSNNPKAGYDMPNVSTLIENGINFTTAHSSHATCAPTRYSILTGNYAIRGRNTNGTWPIGVPSQILPGQVTLAESLKNHGFHTAFIGKLHMGGYFMDDANQPTGIENADITKGFSDGPSSYGFDYSVTLPEGIQGGMMFFLENDRAVRWKDGKSGFEPIKDNASFQDQVEIKEKKNGKTIYTIDNWRTDAVGPILANRTLAFIDEHQKNNADQPFFIHLCTEAAHSPYVPPKNFDINNPLKNVDGDNAIAVKSTTQNYRTDMVYETDVIVGHIIDKLKAIGELDNTIIIFTSDNGSSVKGTWTDPKYLEFKYGFYGGDRIEKNDVKAGGIKHINGQGSENGIPFRMSKGSVYEGGHRVPFVVQWGTGKNAKLNKGSEVSALIGLQDVYPTLMDMLSIDIPDNSCKDAVSFKTYLNDPNSKTLTRSSFLLQGSRLCQEAQQSLVVETAEKRNISLIKDSKGFISSFEGAPKNKKAIGKKLDAMARGGNHSLAIYDQIVENGQVKVYKLIMSLPITFKDDFKIERYKESEIVAWELYELKSDPGENQNLLNENGYADRVAAMKANCWKTLKEGDAAVNN